MNDLISRQGTIDALTALGRDKATIQDWFQIYIDALIDAETKIKALPSAQPETDGFCTDCKEYDKERHFCPRFDRVIKTTIEEMKVEQRWIPCSERLPEEEDSIFAQYYGTDRWRKSMFRKRSRDVIVTSVFGDGELHTEVAHTTDGEWHVGVNVVPRTVIAWMPLPEPYKGGQDACD